MIAVAVGQAVTEGSAFTTTTYCAVVSKFAVTVAGSSGLQPVKVQPSFAVTVAAGNAAPLVTVTTWFVPLFAPAMLPCAPGWRVTVQV